MEEKIKELKKELSSILFILEINRSANDEIEQYKERKKEIEKEIKQIMFNQEINKKEGKML